MEKERIAREDDAHQFANVDNEQLFKARKSINRSFYFETK